MSPTATECGPCPVVKLVVSNSGEPHEPVLGVRVRVLVDVLLGVRVIVGVGVMVRVSVMVGVSVIVGVLEGVQVRVGVGVLVGVLVIVAVGRVPVTVGLGFGQK